MRAGQGFWELIEQLGVRVLPNTAGCHTAKEAVATAEMARELFDTPWIKLEVIANDDTLQPELFGLVEAASILVAQGFQVLPYTTEDLSAAERLAGAGCTRADALGLADRLGARADQPRRAEDASRLLPRHDVDRRRRHRRAVASGGGDGARL